MTRIRGHYPLSRFIGHRGLAASAPENSLAGLRAAAAAGLSACEIDVQAAADGVAVLWHNFDLGRHAAGAVGSHSSEALGRIRIGTCPSTGEPECIPTLAAALDLAASLGLRMVVEIKTVAGRAAADAAAAAAELRKQQSPAVMVASFEPAALECMAEAMPDMPLALNAEVLPARAVAGFDNIHFAWRSASKRRVRDLAAAGHGLYAYTVNSPEQADRLFAMGVDGVFTDTASTAAGSASKRKS